MLFLDKSAVLDQVQKIQNVKKSKYFNYDELEIDKVINNLL